MKRSCGEDCGVCLRVHVAARRMACGGVSLAVLHHKHSTVFVNCLLAALRPRCLDPAVAIGPWVGMRVTILIRNKAPHEVPLISAMVGAASEIRHVVSCNAALARAALIDGVNVTLTACIANGLTQALCSRVRRV